MGLAVDVHAHGPMEEPDPVIGVDHEIASLEILELGDRRLGRRPGRDDPFFGQDVGLAEHGRLLPGIGETPLQVAQGQQDLPGAGPLEGRIDGPGRHALLGQEAHDLAPHGRGGEENEAALALLLEPLHVGEKEGDAVIEPGHRLEPEMDVAPRLLGRQLAGPDGPRPDGRPQRGREIVLGRPDSLAGGGRRGGQLADLLHHVLVFALHVFGRFDDQDGVPQVGRIGNGLLLVHGFDEGRDDAALDLADGPLAGRIEFPDGGDLVAAELDPEGLGMPGRKCVHDAPPVGVFAAKGQQVLADVAEFGQPLKQAVAFERESAFEPDEQPVQAAGPGKRTKQAEKIGQDQGRRTMLEVVEKAGPRRDVLEGGRRSAVGILGQRGKGFDVAGYAQLVQEKPATLLEFGQGAV